jgi:hypothetical protein
MHSVQSLRPISHVHLNHSLISHYKRDKMVQIWPINLAIAVEYWNWLSSKLHPGLDFNRTKHSQIGTGYLANSTNSRWNMAIAVEYWNWLSSKFDKVMSRSFSLTCFRNNNLFTDP